jgi:Glycosyl transferases group 1
MQERGWSSTILYQPPIRLVDLPLSGSAICDSGVFHKGDIVVFQKLKGPNTVAAMSRFRSMGVRTLYIDCDYPPHVAEAVYADLVVSTSDFLTRQYRALIEADIVTLSEAYEITQYHESTIENRDHALRCAWFGVMDQLRVGELQWLRGLLKRRFPSYKLVVVADIGYTQGARWDYEASWDLIASCDVAVITGNKSRISMSKSPNRAIQAMALGLPVIAFPIPSYEQCIQHGRNGFLCRGDEEWTIALDMLRSRRLRDHIRLRGYRYARRYFSPQKMIEQWECIFDRLGGIRQSPPGSARPPLIQAIRLASIRANASKNMALQLANSSAKRELLRERWRGWLDIFTR